MNLWKFSHWRQSLRQLLLGLLVGALVSECGAATNYYVSTSGNDNDPGTLAQPWRTIQRAVNGNGMGAGDTVYVRGGTYVERVLISSRHGTAALPMTVTSYPGETAIIDQNGVTPATSPSALLTIVNSDYIIIKSLEFQNLKSSSSSKDMFGIYIHGACNGVQIRNNKVHDIWQQTTANNGNAHGIAAYGDNATAINNLVLDGNEVHHCLLGSSETVALNGNVTNFTVTNNLIHDCNNIGIDFIGYEGVNATATLDYARNGLCAGNVVYNIDSAYNPSYGGTLGFAAPYGGYGSPTPINNARGAPGIYSDGGASIIIERNLAYQCNMGVEVGSEHSGKNSTGIIVRNNIFHHNHVGGVFMGGAGTGGGTTSSSFTNNTIYANDTAAYGGGEIAVQDNVTATTIKNNIMVCDATGQQFILITGTGNSFAANAIDYNLYSGTTQTALEFIWRTGSNTKVSCSSYSSWKTTSGQDGHSLFTPAANTKIVNDAATGDYTLFSTSLAVNAGDPAFVAASGEKDYGGQSRVASSRVDIGADEYMTYAQAWRDLYFALPDGGTGANPGDDPDNDGLKNAMEYALGGNPTVSSSSIAPVVGQSGGHLTLSFNRNLSVTDVTFTVQASTNLTSWSTIASKVGTASWSVTSGVTVSDFGTGPVTVTDSATIAAGTNRFLRLSVTR